MKPCILLMAALFVLEACNNNDETKLKNPSLVQPPSQAIPDSTKLVNDSVIVPDTTPGNGRQVGKSDSIHQSK